MENLAVSFKNVKKSYQSGQERVEVFKDLDFDLSRSESLAIVGKSGAGKSTLLNLLGAFDFQDSGEIRILNENLKNYSDEKLSLFRRKKLGFVFQFHNLLNDFTILENVMMPLHLNQVAPKMAKEQATEFLNLVGLSNKQNRYPNELSGGEAQRVAVARALVHKPDLILADEPTGNLDEGNAAGIFELLCKMNRELQSTLIVVTHHLKFAKRLNHIMKL